MRITILGASPACPNPGGASAGYLIESGNDRLLVDCGHGVVSFLQTVTDLNTITAIIISHMHPDHFLDLLPLAYGMQFTGATPRPLYLPPGGLRVLEGLQEPLRLHAGFWSEAYHIHHYDPSQSLGIAGMQIAFAATRHFVPANAMRFTDPVGGATAAYTADTGWSGEVMELLGGASLALIEATLLSDASGSVTEGHMTAVQAGVMARQAGVPRAVLTHYWHAIREQLRAEASQAFGQRVEMARQGQVYEV